MTADLFQPATDTRPLAERMRPESLDDYVGQDHILGPGRPLRQAIEAGRLHSLIVWGPPGTGKTTLARLVSRRIDAAFVPLSAVFSGVRDIRTAIEAARREQAEHGRGTIVFVDEVHRFNKAQQDAFLHHVEEGAFIFIGATTENPSFELNNALLSRARVYILRPLDETALRKVIDRALAEPGRGLGELGLDMADPLRDLVARAADGDARRALNLLELLAELAVADGRTEVSRPLVDQVLEGGVRRFDKGGDLFHDQISALHKAVRGSAPDAALYWMGRMLDGGCDPFYIARRVLRMASEDIGNADPRALTIALDAWEVLERLGSPEGELALAQAVVYLSCAAKSDAVYSAFGAAMKDARGSGSLEVPMHLRNAPTRLMRELGHGRGYRYPHHEPGGYAAGVDYFPAELGRRTYYRPVPRGLELKIREKLERLREQDARETSGKPAE